MPVPIIVDEWLFEDLAGNNGRDKQIETVIFLNKLYEICDQIVILEGSSFEKKMNDFTSSTNDSPPFRLARSAFIELISRNSVKKHYLLKDDVTALPKAFIPLINDPPDHYL